MKRFLTLFMILGLIAGSVATAQGKQARPKRVERTVEGSYITQEIPGNSWCKRHNGMGCVTIETRKDEAFLTGKAVDAHGRPVLVRVVSTYPGSTRWIDHGSFCGETDEPIDFIRGVDLYLVVGYGGPNLTDPVPSQAECDPMFGTAGTVRVTLSNLP